MKKVTVIKVETPGVGEIKQIINGVMDDISKFPVTDKIRDHLAAIIVNEISRRLGREIMVSIDVKSLEDGFLRR
ncbi:hypothetical protein G6S35_003114 [Salmonella enterica]|nr:hypothetical protein [Salmonella enterica]